MIPIEDVYRQISEFARDAGAEKVVLFGSRARGCAGPKSDIDLAVYGCPAFEAFKCRIDEELWSYCR